MNAMAENAAYKSSVEKNVERGAAQIKDTSEKFTAATEQTTKMIENTLESAAKGIKDYNLKAVEFAQLNSDAAFEHAKQLMGAKSPAEMLELWSTYLRKQFEVLSDQSRELASLGQRVATETAEPLAKRSQRGLN
jgi:phasin